MRPEPQTCWHSACGCCCPTPSQCVFNPTRHYFCTWLLSASFSLMCLQRSGQRKCQGDGLIAGETSGKGVHSTAKCKSSACADLHPVHAGRHPHQLLEMQVLLSNPSLMLSATIRHYLCSCVGLHCVHAGTFINCWRRRSCFPTLP